MNKYYITFGQSHTHIHNGNTLDKNCVGVVKANSYEEMRNLVFEWFDDKFATTYTVENFKDAIKYFSRGFIELN